MAGRRRLTRRAVIIGALCAALLAGLLAVFLVDRDAPVRAAAEPTPAETAEPGEVPLVTFIGDSWTEGTGATGRRGYAVLTADQLGWDSFLLGVGGSGYAQPGRGTTFDERVELAVGSDPDVLVVQGSLNDQRTPAEQLEQAAVTTLTHLRAAVDPGTAVLVVGASYTPSTDRDVIDDINATLAAVAEQTGFDFVDPAAENWTDPDDDAIWADPNHPNDAGCRQIADRLAPLLEAALEG